MRLPTSFSFLESCSSKDLRHSLITSFCRGGFEMKSWMALRCATHLLFCCTEYFFCILGFEKVINNNKKLTSTFLISMLNKQPKHFFFDKKGSEKQNHLLPLWSCLSDPMSSMPQWSPDRKKDSFFIRPCRRRRRTWS